MAEPVKQASDATAEEPAGEVAADVDVVDEQGPDMPPTPQKKKEPDALIGKVINDRFRIEALIARGGMGKVYKAEQAPLGREVALKVLNPNYHGDNDPEFHKRFFLEASICSKLTHPNTVTIFDYGRTDDDIYYIAMEYLVGQTLHRSLREGGPLPPERAMHIARQICRSLREAHALGVIHRDLKPANIYLVNHGDEGDFVKVLDFGLVKDLGDKGEDLTQTGLFMGSPKYMSPEQIRGERVDARCDVYALGVILYEMLTGKVPFDRANSVNILMAHVHEAPPPMQEANPDVQVPPMLQNAVMKAMSKKPEDRFAGMDEFLVALKQVASQSGLAVSRSGETSMSGEFAAVGGTGSYPPVQLTGNTPSGPMTPSGSFAPGAAMTPSGATPVPLDIENPFEKKPGAGRWIAAVVLLAAAVVGGYMALKSGPTPVAQPNTNTNTNTGALPTADAGLAEAAHDAGAATADAGAATAPAVRPVMVTLRSTPPGATVEVDGRSWTTPADVEWTGDEAAIGREVTFQFRLEGHRDFTVTRTVTGDSLDVSAELSELEAQPVPIRRPIRRPRTQPTVTMDNGASIGVKGYKAEPY